MRTINAEVYPVTAELTAAVVEAGYGDLPVAQQVVDIVGEYEHGAADVEDVCEQEPINIKQYAAVALDIILSIGGES